MQNCWQNYWRNYCQQNHASKTIAMKTSRLIPLLVYPLSFFFIAELSLKSLIAQEQSATSITAPGYMAFLNSQAKEDPYHLYQELLSSSVELYPILRLGKPGSYHYELLLETQVESAKEVQDHPIFFTNLYEETMYDAWVKQSREESVDKENAFDIGESLIDFIDEKQESEYVQEVSRLRLSTQEKLVVESPDCSSDFLLKSSLLAFSIRENFSPAHVAQGDSMAPRPISPEELTRTSEEALLGLILFGMGSFACYDTHHAWKDYHEITYSPYFEQFNIRGGVNLTHIALPQGGGSNFFAHKVRATLFPNSKASLQQETPSKHSTPQSNQTSPKSSSSTPRSPESMLTVALKEASAQKQAALEAVSAAALHKSIVGYIAEKVPDGFLNEHLVSIINQDVRVRDLIKERAEQLAQEIDQLHQQLLEERSNRAQVTIKEKFGSAIQQTFEHIDQTYFGLAKNKALALYKIDGIHRNIPKIIDCITEMNKLTNASSSLLVENSPCSLDLQDSISTYQEASSKRTPVKKLSSSFQSQANNLVPPDVRDVPDQSTTLEDEQLKIYNTLLTRVLFNPKAELEQELLYQALDCYQKSLNYRSEDTKLRNLFKQTASLLTTHANQAEKFDSPQKRVLINNVITKIKSLCAIMINNREKEAEQKLFRKYLKVLTMIFQSKTSNEINKSINEINQLLNNQETQLQNLISEESRTSHLPVGIDKKQAGALMDLLLESHHYAMFERNNKTQLNESNNEREGSNTSFMKGKENLRQAFHNLKASMKPESQNRSSTSSVIDFTDHDQDNQATDFSHLGDSAIFFRKAAEHAIQKRGCLAGLFDKVATEYSALTSSSGPNDVKKIQSSAHEALNKEFKMQFKKRINEQKTALISLNTNHQSADRYLNIANNLYEVTEAADLLNSQYHETYDDMMAHVNTSLDSILQAADASKNGQYDHVALHAHMAYAKWMTFQNILKPQDKYISEAWSNMHKTLSELLDQLECPNNDTNTVQRHLINAFLYQRKAEGSLLDFMRFYSQKVSRHMPWSYMN